jgi:membrane protein DedA with SNARE-associated domain
MIVPMIAFWVVSIIGDAIAPTLVDTHPLLLIALNPRIRNMVLVVNQVDPVWFYVVGTVRLLLSDPLWYLLGYYWGDRAVAWVEGRSDTWGRYAREFEKFYKKAAYPLVIAIPNNWICLFAGSAGMRPVVFFSLNIAGTIGRLYLIALFGEAFEEPIDWVLDFIQTWRWYLVALSVTIVAITTWRQARSGSTEIQDLIALEEELEREDAGEREAPDATAPVEGEDQP